MKRTKNEEDKKMEGRKKKLRKTGRNECWIGGRKGRIRRKKSRRKKNKWKI